MAQHETIRPQDVDRIVAALDETARTEFFRDPDRPDGKFVRPQQRRRPIDVIRAQGRVRSARWRAELDRRRVATLEQIGKSLCVALATTDRISELSDAEWSLVGRMIADLKARGFDVVASKDTLRKLRLRLVDPADRDGEPTETTGRPVQPSEWGDDLVF